MLPSEAPTNSEADATARPDVEPYRLRSYQAEMVEESLRSNIICVMDTGSGKTHIAIERTRAELEKCQSDKIVWFLAPTVTLCEQQYDVFKSNLPGCGIQLLCGKDGVDHWRDQSVWDAVLLNVRIVLSTHAVLHDALTHAFVKMSQITLLIFDEAHHCSRNHAARLIMSDFYNKENGGDQLPSILGLSASPVKRATATYEDLQQIERNLYATARTPKMHRLELMRYVHRPLLMRMDHPVEVVTGAQSRLLLCLENANASYDLMADPYVLELLKQQQEGHDISKKFQKVMLSGKTYCRDQLNTLAVKAKAMAEELGVSPMKWYVHQCTSAFEKAVRTSSSQLFDTTIDEKQHLLSILQQLPCSNTSAASEISIRHVSRKVELLVQLLVAEAMENAEFTGLVFVEQRVWVAILAEILSVHPLTKDLFRVGTFVGTSQSSKRKAIIATFAEPKNQQTTLHDFRAGKINLILATSVLEEGIDVSSCNFVVDFERPKNLKSFVQRRGRARKQESKYWIFVPEVGGGRPPESWESLEEEMKAAYMDDMRQVHMAEERELEEEEGHRSYRVPATGALLTLDNASQHLHHFCALLNSDPFVDTRPQFEFTNTPLGSITARVILPISVDPAVRFAASHKSWKTERMAKKDAAFEAYKKLFLEGFVNENMLPASEEADDDNADFQTPDNRPSFLQASPAFDPWPLIARYHQDNPHVYHRTLLRIEASGDEPIFMVFLTPVPLPTMPKITLYWNETKQFTVSSFWLPGSVLDDEEITLLKNVTFEILHPIYQTRMAAERYDFVWLLLPCDSLGQPMNKGQLKQWISAFQGPQSAAKLIAQGQHDLNSWGLVNEGRDARRYIVKTIDIGDAESRFGATTPYLEVVRLPKRRDFLHRVAEGSNTNEAYTKTERFTAKSCMVDDLPVSYTTFALFFPSILHKFQVSIVVETLRTSLLEPVSFEPTTLQLLTQALTSSFTDGENNYQRLEFLGDCILKFIASVHLMAAKPKWPEGRLTGKKGRIVSNGFLARASLAAGLDKFVITDRFTGAKWSPNYAGDLLADSGPPQKVERSSKLVADVIESLIGASYLVGGFDKAFSCVHTLLPMEAWTPISHANDILYDNAHADTTVGNLGILETLIGHTFHKKALLLEAVTHGSYQGPYDHCSYERLEFLGDAVLDYIVSSRVYAHNPPLSHPKMHAIRTAMVNASFLTFRMFETTVQEQTTNKATMESEMQSRALWQFLRATSPPLLANRDAALKQHASAREQIIAALEGDARYPWHLLSMTLPPKFLSDIVESTIGAIYIDSHGDLSACEMFVRRLGILDCLERILHDGVDCLHPKERLGILAVDRKVQYVTVVKIEEPNFNGKGMHRCQVKVGGEDVGGVVEGLNSLTAETIAAWQAISIIERVNDVAMEGMQASIEDDVFEDAEEAAGGMFDDAD